MAFWRYLVIGGVLLFLPVAALAQDQTAQVAEAAGFLSGNLLDIIGRLIKVFLGLLGVIALLLTLYSGYLWMTAGGDDNKVNEAKTILRNAVIGLLIIMSAYAIVSFIFNSIAGGGLGGGNNPNGRVGVERLSGALGQVIGDHYPDRGATEIPRNTKIIVTFREPIKVDSIITGGEQGGLVDAGAVAIYPATSSKNEALTEVNVTYTEDLKTFVFNPVQYLGSPTEEVTYAVHLSSDILLAGGGPALPRDPYEWRFTTSTVLDLNPPTVVSFRPSAGGTFARNILYQVTFDEPMDPSSTTGTRTAGGGFDHLTVGQTLAAPVPGTYTLSNGYRTVTFVPTDACGTNSCGETLYCLPGSTSLTAVVQAADLSSEAPQAIVPYTGVADVAGNSLDGNDDGTAGDDVTWTFNTSADIALTGPQLRGPLSPDLQQENIPLDLPISFETEDILMISSVSSTSVALTNVEQTSGEPHEQWFNHRSSFVDAAGLPVTGPTQVPERTVVTMPHGTFLASVDGLLYEYEVRVTEGLRNEYQNCFVPAKGPGAGGAATCGTSLAQPNCCNGTPSAAACPALVSP